MKNFNKKHLVAVVLFTGAVVAQSSASYAGSTGETSVFTAQNDKQLERITVANPFKKNGQGFKNKKRR